MKRGVSINRDSRWSIGLAGMLALVLVTGCGKVPTWNELTGQQPAQQPAQAAPSPAPAPIPVVPTQPVKVDSVSVIAEFKALQPNEINNQTIGKLTSLTEGLEAITEIDATSGGVDSTGLSGLSKLPALKSLKLENTKVDDKGMPYLAQVPSLESLTLNGTSVSDSGIASLTALPNLKKLELRGCHLTSEGFASIGKMPALEEINLDATGGLNDVTFELMCEARTLKIMRLRDCGGITDQGLLALRKLEVLEELYINRSPATGYGFGQVTKQGGLKNLRALGISVAPINDQGAKAINTIKSLEWLDLQQVSTMNDFGLVEIIQGMRKLKFLKIAECKNVNGVKAFVALKVASDLEELHAYGTSVNDAALVFLKGFKKLRLLEITTTNCSLGGVQGLKKALPDCEIRFAGQRY